jgi:hypothetical protein
VEENVDGAVETVAQGVQAGDLLALSGARTGGFFRILAIGLDVIGG